MWFIQRTWVCQLYTTDQWYCRSVWPLTMGRVHLVWYEPFYVMLEFGTPPVELAGYDHNYTVLI